MKIVYLYIMHLCKPKNQKSQVNTRKKVISYKIWAPNTHIRLQILPSQSPCTTGMSPRRNTSLCASVACRSCWPPRSLLPPFAYQSRMSRFLFFSAQIQKQNVYRTVSVPSFIDVAHSARYNIPLSDWRLRSCLRLVRCCWRAADDMVLVLEPLRWQLARSKARSTVASKCSGYLRSRNSFTIGSPSISWYRLCGATSTST